MTPGTTISVLTGLAWIAATGYVALDFVSAEQARITARNISGGGMSDPAGPKALDLGRKLVSAERALAAIRAGSRIYLGTGCAAPAQSARRAGGDGTRPARPRVRQLRHDVGAAASGGRYPYSLSPSGVFRRQRSARLGAAAANSTTCRSRSRRCRNFWRADGCRSTWRCFRFPRPMPAASSASACPWTSRLRS